MATRTQPSEQRTGALPVQKLPGHWLLARLGKRVLRPGGVELTNRMLKALDIGPQDAVVEFAPGLGATARRVLACQPASYIGVERDQAAADELTALLAGPNRRWIVGSAERTELPDASASAVYGEALLTMLPETAKQRVIAEAHRILQPGGRYGIHELCLVPDELDDARSNRICADLSASIHIGARPHKAHHWRALLEGAGFTIEAEKTTPMRLLDPIQFLHDEGFSNSLRFTANLLRDRHARRRVVDMRSAFHRHRAHLAAVCFVARKPGGEQIDGTVNSTAFGDGVPCSPPSA